MVDPLIKEKLKEKYPTEKVLAVPFGMVEKIPDKFHILKAHGRASRPSVRKWDVLGTFVARYEAEYNDALIQLIPYTIIFSTRRNKFLVAKRIAGDDRLISKHSIGFGGHVNPEDMGDKALSAIEKAQRRELLEEVAIRRYKGAPVLFGTVRDLSSKTPDHLGFCYLQKCETAKIVETDTLSGIWMSISELADHYHSFESWSRYIIDHIFQVHYMATGSYEDSISQDWIDLIC